MATKQKMAEKQGSICKGSINTLSSLAIQNRNKSAALMKEVTSLVVSSILYYRKIIPPEMFVDKKLGVQKVKILKTNNNHNMADNFCAMIFSVHEAIELGYLKKLIITFMENEKPVEIHRLYFEHTGESYKTIMIDQVYSTSKIHVKHQINRLKESIYETISRFIQTLLSVPYVIERPHVGVELNYFEEITPKDYLPPHFEAFDESKKKHRLATQPINFGEIATPFHGLILKSQFRSGLHEGVIEKIKEIRNASDEELETINKPERSETTALLPRSETLNSLERSEIANPQETAASETMNFIGVSEMMTSDETEINKILNSNTSIEDFTEIEKQLVGDIGDTTIKDEDSYSQLQQNQEGNVIDLTQEQPEAMDSNCTRKEGELQCPCKIKIDEGVKVKCENCKTFQHIYCFDMLIKGHVPTKHICDVCAARNPKLQCTVPELSTMDTEAKLKRCIFRLVLGLTYYRSNKVSKEYLTNILLLSDSFANELLKRIDQLQLIHRAGGTINRRLFESKTIPDIFRDHSKIIEELESPPVAKKRLRLSQ
ncbi:HORMA domain-containing protein 1-like [Chrysoperla carnea]|uniref:HORMA domain-containing protein 1-like n=1 Tax=Chrysoperla carnea TaxID=189513 RepID=UPI001D06D1E7|nr:HORMA domain-containing protein 1-like [Chrysoperla carnea]